MKDCLSIPFEMIELAETLADAERGRLYSALYRYVKTGKKEELSGNERYLYAIMTKQIDLHNVRAAAGRKGGLTKNDQFATSKTQANGSKPQANASKNPTHNIIYNNTNNTTPSTDTTESKKRTVFIRPTLEDVNEYIKSQGYSVDGERFMDYYDSIGWVVGRKPMRDWKAAVRTWHRNGYGNQNGGGNDGQRGGPSQNAESRWGRLDGIRVL